MNSSVGNRLPLVLMLVVVGSLVGCQTVPEARYVEKSPTSGVIALPYHSVENRALADQLMTEHFPDGFRVDREAEVVTGTVTEEQEHVHLDPIHTDSIHHVNGSDEQHAHRPASADRRTVSTTRDTTEWRISYSRVE